MITQLIQRLWPYKDQGFAEEVLKGLSSKNKHLSSKHFYDDVGSVLFNQITHSNDYYLSTCELEILERYKKEMSEVLDNHAFNIIELGPGEGIKTLILMDQFLKDKRDFIYFPLDISRRYLSHLKHFLHKKLPTLKIKPINGDISKELHYMQLKPLRRNLVLFFGSSIGNFNRESAKKFLQTLWKNLNNGDYLLIGFDLRKDISTLLKAYNDGEGITKAFNLNLLDRINKELKANFNIDFFRHYATYNAYSNAMESFLISLKKQEVYSKVLDHTFYFEPFESIYVESSHKYLPREIEDFAHDTGFQVLKNFTDSKNYFIDSLWQVCKDQA